MKRIFAASAAVVLALILAGAPQPAAAGPADLDHWRSIESSRNPFAFERFLGLYPTSVYAPRAERRLVNLRRVDDRKRRERALGLTRSQRREVELRLSRAGFYPGSINGDFNRDTRLAIRDFRAEYGLPRHRFLDSRMVRVLVDATDRNAGVSFRPGRRSVDNETAAGFAAGALLLGGVILLAD